MGIHRFPEAMAGGAGAQRGVAEDSRVRSDTTGAPVACRPFLPYLTSSVVLYWRREFPPRRWSDR